MFDVRDAQERDVSSVNRLFCSEYGYDYPYQITHFDANHINLVAEVRGKIVGFARAAPYGRFLHIWELCSLVVHADFRKKGIANAFTIERISRLQKMGVKVLVSESVTCYEDCASQRNLKKFGFSSFGLMPFVHPRIRPEVLGEQPLSLVLMVKYLNGGTGFGTRPLFLHDDDRHVLSSFRPELHRLIQNQQTSLCSDRSPYHHKGKMVEGVMGAEFIDIVLNHPSALDFREDYRRKGWHLACIVPGFDRDENGTPIDLLRLYRPPLAQLTFDLVYVTPELYRLKNHCAHQISSP